MSMSLVMRVRHTYLNTCKQNGVSPSVSFLNQFRESLEKKKPLQRISVTHGSCGDGQVAPVIAVLKQAPAISDIALNYIDLTDEGCCQLLSFLSKHTFVSSLELFGNRIGNFSCALIPPLLNLQTLTRLKLGDNTISASGARYIAEGLKNQNSLIQLHLGGNNIGDEGLIALVEALQSNSTLTSLGIRDNGIGALGIKALVQLLCQDDCVLSEVQLKGNAIGDEGAEFLACAMLRNRTMRVLEVQANNVGPRGAAVLCNALHNNMVVHAINFNDNALSDEGAEAVAALLMNNTCITTVGISGNSIEKRGTNAIARALACNVTLTGIDLGNNRLGNSGIITLANVLKDQNSTLMSLDVHLNNMNLQGVFALTQALLVNTSLRHLDCGSNYSRNQGAHAWAKVIRKSASLTRLCLTDNEIGREGGESLLQAMRFNTTLRNFQFGGQSQMHPLANRITPATRRAINGIVARNKHIWEEGQGPPELARGPPRRPSSDGVDLFGFHPLAGDEPQGDFRTVSGEAQGSHSFGEWDHPLQTPQGVEKGFNGCQGPAGQRPWECGAGPSPSKPMAAPPCQGATRLSSSKLPQAPTMGHESRLRHYIGGGGAPPGHTWLDPWLDAPLDPQAFDHESETGEIFCFQGAGALQCTTPQWRMKDTVTLQPDDSSALPAGHISSARSSPSVDKPRPVDERPQSVLSSPYSTYRSSVGSVDETPYDTVDDSPMFAACRRNSMGPHLRSVFSLPPSVFTCQSPALAQGWSRHSEPSDAPQVGGASTASVLHGKESASRVSRRLSRAFSEAEGPLRVELTTEPLPPAPPSPAAMDESTLRAMMAALASIGMEPGREGPHCPVSVPSQGFTSLAMSI
eukprot:GGOE01008445.1.p1 GENE.GGOE01008445.1~~GGOE01008445.1.p1  ORF type:complete len:860 (+),score=127.55 GGOE01008445.1:129-2708(+)